MEVWDAISRRRMVRAFSSKPLRAGLIDELCDQARRAPSAGNTQAVGFVVLDTPEAVASYWDTTLPEPRRSGFRWSQLLSAPVIVLLTTSPDAYPTRYSEPDKAQKSQPDKAQTTQPDKAQTTQPDKAQKSQPDLGSGLESWPVPFWWVDAGAVAQNLLLLVVAEGLGACLFGLFQHEEAVKNRFGLDPDRRIVAAIAIGSNAVASKAVASNAVASNGKRSSSGPGRSALRARPPLSEVLHRPSA